MDVKKVFGIRSVILVMILAASGFLLGSDMEVFVKWWLCLVTMGVGFWPLTQSLLGNFTDKGWMVSKVLGIAGTGFLVWLLTCVGITRFNFVTCLMLFLLCIALNWGIWFLTRQGKDKTFLTLEELKTAFDGELVFLFMFLLWTYFAGFRPEAYGTEKFMDYGFMMTMMRSETLPAPDMWYAGKNLNYYYGGQYFAVFLTKLTRTEVTQTYNLMRTMIAGFAFALPFVLVRQMVWDFHTSRGLRKTNSGNFAGVFAGAAVSLAGNMHYVVVGSLLPWIRNLLGMEPSEYSYWFPNSTRYIGYYPAENDKTIHEFPSYSFVLGDLHAHVVNVLFVVALICIIYGMVQKYQNLYKDGEMQKVTLRYFVQQIFLEPYIFVFAFFIGLFHWTNYWDFIIYFVMGGFGVIYCNYLQFSGLENKKEAVKYTALLSVAHAVWVFVLATIFALPFTLQFDSMANGIALAQNHSRLYQWWLIWGVQVALAAVFFVAIFWEWKKRKKTISYADWFGIILAVSALGLIVIPEIIYVRDIYEEGYARANTMFKLTYQAFIMFGLLAGYMSARIWMLKKQYIVKILTAMALVCVTATFGYIATAVTSWFGQIQNPSLYKGLDATAFLETSFVSDAKAIDWLNENVEGNVVVVEAQGDSYSDYQRVSAMTGLSTLAGWYVHEWLWRNDLQDLNYRIAVLESIYTSDNEEMIRGLLDDYDVEYIYVGRLEREKYTNINEGMICSLGKVVFSDLETNTYIIEVEN